MFAAYFVVAASLICGQPGTGATPGGTQANTGAPGMRPVCELSNDELIERLPPARQEQVRQSRSGAWTEDAAAAEWRRRIIANKVSPDELARALRACGLLRSSPTCIEGQPYHVWMRMPTWLEGEDATAKPRLPGLAQANTGAYMRGLQCGNALEYEESRESFQRIGVLPAGTTGVEFEVVLRPSLYFDGPKINQSVSVTLPVRLIPAAAPQPVATDELTNLVKSAVGLSCSNGYYQDGPSIWLNAWMRRPLTGPLTDTLVTLQTELLKDGVVVLSSVEPDPDELYGEDSFDISSGKFLRGDIARDVVERKGIERFSVRVTGVASMTPVRLTPAGTPQAPMNQWCRTQYWTGTFSVPLSELLEPESGMRPAGLCGPEGTR